MIKFIEMLQKTTKTPKVVRVGWRGDLPWVDCDGITTFYEAKILKISRCKDYLEQLIVDISVNITKKQYSENIMSEKKKISRIYKNAKIRPKKNHEILNDKTTELPKIGCHANTNRVNRTISMASKNGNLMSTIEQEVNKNVKASSADELQPSSSKSTTSKAIDQPLCRICLNCICKNWQSNVTPEIIVFMQQQTHDLQQFLVKKDSSGENVNFKIELFPNTKLYLTSRQFNLVCSKSNSNPREIARCLLTCIITKEEFIVLKTAEGMNSSHPLLREAI